MTDLASPPEPAPGPDVPPTSPGPAPAAAKRGPGRPKGSTKKRPDVAPKKAPGSKGAGRPSGRAVLERKLGEQLAGVGAMLALLHPADGLAIVKHSESVAAALAKLADENPKVKRFLEGGLTGSAWLGVVVAVGGLGLELAANHGLLGPVGGALTGASSPDDAGAGLDLSALAALLDTDDAGADGSR